MVDRYYRKIEDVENDIENAMQISSILLKIKENDKKLGNLSKIGDNESNISSNLGKIGENKNDIASNLGKIETNENNISLNLDKIDNNKSDIDEINLNLSNIAFKSNNKYFIENFFIYNIEIENSYKINEDKPSFSMFKYTLEDDFKKDSILEIDCRLLYQYTNYNNIGLLQHIFKLYDDTDNMFYDYKSLITNSGDNRRNDIKQNNIFFVKLNNNYKIIKIELILSLIDDANSDLEYQDTDDRHYEKSIYEIFDENDNSLYVKSVTNNSYLYFSNRLIIDDNIFYNLITDVKK